MKEAPLRPLPLSLLAAGLLLGWAAWQFSWSREPAAAGPDKPGLAALSHAAAGPDEPILPLPAPPALNPDKVALGRLLFHDPRLSANNGVACASCHDLAHGGADGKRVSTGVGGAQGEVNAPSVLTAALNFRQFWDGRAATLEEQVGGPLTNPAEMASSWPAVLAKLRADPLLRQSFERLYPDGVSEASVRSAIADFERSLPQPSRFDRWLRGDRQAITAEEETGYRLFKKHGCVGCHQGANIGGNLFQRFGIMTAAFADKRQLTRADLGRYNVTGRDEDRQVFKVPSLRNVGLTAPYFHDGSVVRLETAVAIMGRSQLGIELPADDIRHIVAFLRTLSGGSEQ